ncbi:hypothetical protein PsYK624_042430 [Phanerochaete sordida]|uniref:Uncharacterized protein n=1 Tax=Phanerochaete sordida TaxID=48140 RepID=A0A9P3G5E7_9APHY|nr:hypothetical protein PsYK624_042430 [Phanerochaete sordida]
MYSLKLGGLFLPIALLRYPQLSQSPKAAPTISLSSTNVERDGTPQSIIPFPSAPIQCSGVSFSREDVEMEDDALSSSPATDCHLNVARRHSRSYLAASFVHEDEHAMPHGLEEGQSVAQNGVPLRKRKLANKRPKLPSTPAIQPPRKKSKKASKRQAADLQFTVTLHRSLASHLRTFTSYTLAQCAVDAPEDELILRSQDRILVERLWKSLVDQGLQPVPFTPSLSPLSLPPVADPFVLSPERVDHVFQSEPIAVDGLCGLPTPPPSPTSSSAPSAPVFIPPCTAPAKDDFCGRPLPASGTPEHSAGRNTQGNALPTPPPTPPPADAPVLAMSSIVASLILRHRERSAARARSGSACSAGVRAGRSRSPLATYVLVAPSCVSA